MEATAVEGSTDLETGVPQAACSGKAHRISPWDPRKVQTLVMPKGVVQGLKEVCRTL